MSKIQFIKSETIQEGVVIGNASSAVIDITLTAEADERDILAGFNTLNEHNNKVMGKYTDYKTVYRKFDELHYQLSNDGSVYVPPVVKTEAVVSFVGTEHLTLSFTEKTVKIGSDISDIKFPKVTSDDEDYTLASWNRTEGKIEEDITIYAYEKFEHIPSLDEVKTAKITELANVCEQMIVAGVDVEIDGEKEHFSYTTKDQANIDDLINMIVQTKGLAQPYHADDKLCKLYTPAQVISIYVAEKVNKTHHITYNNSIKAYLLTLTDKESVEAVTYGQPLEGTFLDNYNAMMAQASDITKAVLENMGVDLNAATQEG